MNVAPGRRLVDVLTGSLLPAGAGLIVLSRPWRAAAWSKLSGQTPAALNAMGLAP